MNDKIKNVIKLVKVNDKRNNVEIVSTLLAVKEYINSLEKVKKLIPLIEEKIENAKNDLRASEDDNPYYELLGEIGAYTDILLLLKEVLENAK